MFRNKFLSYKNDTSSLILRDVEDREGVFYYFSGEKFENKVKLNWSNSFKQNGIRNTRVSGFDSVNGMLCLYNGRTGFVVLWNPTTRTIKHLPPSDAQLIEWAMSMPLEIAGHHVDYCVHGFGYDHVINDYKVIWYVDVYVDSLGGMIDPNMRPRWEIYSLRSNKWRKLQVDMPYSSKYMDGVCHWLCEDYETVGPCLVSFYLNNEKFLVTLIPSDVEDACFDTIALWINLAVLKKSIALISYHEETTTFHISILCEFGMKESWIKLLIVGPLFCVERPIKVGTKGEIFFVREDEELVWLDLSTQRITELGYKGANSCSRIIIYKDGILPIEGKQVINCVSCFHQDLSKFTLFQFAN
jgi:F-box interacting protein